MINLADSPCDYEFSSECNCGHPPVVVADHVDAAVGTGLHPASRFASRERISQRLFAENDLFGRSGGQRDWEMDVSWCADIDDVNILAADISSQEVECSCQPKLRAALLTFAFVAAANDF